jgi:DNA-binding CsgD family transcriptional regulator
MVKRSPEFRLADLSGLLFELYRLADVAPADAFRSQALAAVQRVLPFDSALWALGSMTSDGPAIHTVHLENQPPAMMAEWERIKQHDVLMQAALARPGTMLVATWQGPVGGPAFEPVVVEHVTRWGMQHTLASISVDPALNLMHAISLFRADRQHAFDEGERQFGQALMPHLLETHNRHRMNALLPQRKEPERRRAVRAVCDRFGMIHVADADFAASLQRERPDWVGPYLPREWLDAARGRYLGTAIAASLTPANDMWQVDVRDISVLDRLSRRELDIARRYGAGLNYQALATELCLSPSTVRNHLTHIYSKLGVNSKAQLAQLVGLQS